MLYNVGGVDRFIRLVLGLAVLSLVWFGPATAWGYLGLVPLFSGLFGYCPIYHLLKVSTNPRAPVRPAA